MSGPVLPEAAAAGGDRLASFEAGDAIEVPVPCIEQELAALWRDAAARRVGPRPVTRACLWNLVVRSGDDDFRGIKRLVNDISAAIPTRALVLHADPGGEGEVLRAWVEANWHGDAERATGSDEVTLYGAGRAAARLPALVRSLLVTDAPTAMLWPGAAPAEAAPVRELLPEVDRLIVDSRRLHAEDDLVGYARLALSYPRLELVDLAWVGVRPLRGLCAGLFDPPGDPALLEALSRVRVTSGVRGAQTRALLALGWLAARLGWRELRPASTDAQGTRRWTATRRQGGQVTLELATRLGDANHGVRAIELEAGPGGALGRWAIERAAHVIEVTGPGIPSRAQPMRKHSDAELISVGLGPRGRDPQFREALALAAALLEAQWGA